MYSSRCLADQKKKTQLTKCNMSFSAIQTDT